MKIINLTLAAGVLVLSSNANADLQSRLGGLAYFNDEANLTWLADANYAKTSGYAAANTNTITLPYDKNTININGTMGWQAANDWAAQLTVGGVSGWRLPDTLQQDASCTDQYSSYSGGYNCSGSEMGGLFYTVLGNTAGSPGVSSLTNTGPFSNIVGSSYWSATEYAVFATDAWSFYMDNGYQTNNADISLGFFGWAVQSGDVSAVPVPAAVWLFGSGLISLIGIAKRKARA